MKEYVSACETCQKNKSKTLMLVGLLQPLLVSLQVWDDITLDSIERLSSSNRKDTILVIIGGLTKYTYFIVVSYPFTCKNVAEIFMENVIKLHGMLKSIVSDRGPIFINNLW